jgi:hypothetical protein
VTPAALLFRVGAFVALGLLVRYAWRREGPRVAMAFVAYLVVMAAVREWAVHRLTESIQQPIPYTADARLGQLGAINVVVVAGWVFTALLSFALAREIQRRSLPGTNVFLTLALTALVTTSISYCVEVTGMRISLWRWTQPTPVWWLPFDWPFDAFEGWASTSFMLMLVYCAARYRLFARSLWASAAITLAVLLFFGLADLSTPWLGPESPRKKVTLLYVAAAVILGFKAPKAWLGTSPVEV